MSDKKVTVLDVLARLESLEQKNKVLEQELNELKSELAPENWRELIIYRPNDHQTPREITWTDDEDQAKRDYYTHDEPIRRDIIGKVRRVK